MLTVLGSVIAVLAVLLAVLRGSNKQLKQQNKIEKIKFIQEAQTNEHLTQSQQAIKKANLAVNRVDDAVEWLRNNANRDNHKD